MYKYKPKNISFDYKNWRANSLIMQIEKAYVVMTFSSSPKLEKTASEKSPIKKPNNFMKALGISEKVFNVAFQMDAGS